jgi:hypothetical protein
MDLCPTERAVRKPNGSITFEFPPPLAAMALSQCLEPPDAAARGDQPDIGNIAEDLEH